MKEVLIWGVGKNYHANKHIIRNDIEIIGFVDNNGAVQGTVLDGKLVHGPEQIQELRFDFIFIFCQKYAEVRKQIMRMDTACEYVVYDISQIEMLCDLPPTVYYNYIDSGNDNRDRLLIFSPALSSTGAQNMMLAFIQHIVRAYQVTVVSKSDGPVRERLEALGVSIVITGDYRLENEAIRKEIYRAELILVNTIWLGYLVDNLRSVRKKTIWWLHESAMLSYIDRACIRRCLLADNIYPYAVSDIVVSYLEKECGLHGSIGLFPIGLPEYATVADNYHDKTIFAIIGGLNYIKGQDVFVRAVSMLPTEKREQAEFWIIGGGCLDPETQATAEKITEIKIKGEIDNRQMPGVYADLDVVVCCSREESMSVTVIEGFMNRKNTIVSDRAGVAAYITDGVNGFVVSNEDTQRFADRMLWIIDHPTESSAMGLESRKLYDENFTEKVFDETVERVFAKVREGRITLKPKVSVIMPIYNAEKYVKKTIECILAQTFSDFELVLINDHPTDSTMDIVRSIKDDRIRIIDNEKNMGIAYSRNVGLKHAQGKYIALMDDDDLCPAYRLQCEYDFLEQNPHIAAVGGGFRIINGNDEFVSGVTPTLQNPGYVRAQLMFYCSMYNGSTMFRKQIVDDHHIQYLDNCLGMEDYRFWVEFARYGKMTNVTDALLYWRQAPTTETIKVLNNKVEQRERKFADIQRYAIESQGFDLTEDEIKIFTDSFMELKRRKEGQQGLNDIYRVFRKMIDQAREKGMDNAREVMQACRNRFLEKVKESTIWE